MSRQFNKELVRIVNENMTRSPHKHVTNEMFMKQWVYGDYIIETALTEDCPEIHRKEISHCLVSIYGLLDINLDCSGWRPTEFSKIASQINISLKGYGTVAVAQEWAFENNKSWNNAKRLMLQNYLAAKNYLSEHV